jgi:hypothetical protein
MNRRILGIVLGIFCGTHRHAMVLKRVSARHAPIAVDAPRDAVMARYGSVSRRSPGQLALSLRISA